MMTLLFEARLREGIHDGSITMTFRRWRRSQVVAGGRYRTGLDMIEVDRVDTVTPSAISHAVADRQLARRRRVGARRVTRPSHRRFQAGRP